jgi:hypothetical protein
VETKKHTSFPLVFLFVKLALILPVATATVERAFFAMKIIKSDLRNRIGDYFLYHCLITYVEIDIFLSISIDSCIPIRLSMITKGFYREVTKCDLLCSHFTVCSCLFCPHKCVLNFFLSHYLSLTSQLLDPGSATEVKYSVFEVC